MSTRIHGRRRVAGLAALVALFAPAPAPWAIEAMVSSPAASVMQDSPSTPLLHSTQPRVSLAAASTDETKGDAFYGFGCLETRSYVDWSTGTTAGEVVIETSPDRNRTGGWAHLATVTFAGTAPVLNIVHITGAMDWVRARVNTAVSDGTVSADLRCIGP